MSQEALPDVLDELGEYRVVDDGADAGARDGGNEAIVQPIGEKGAESRRHTGTSIKEPRKPSYHDRPGPAAVEVRRPTHGPPAQEGGSGSLLLRARRSGLRCPR